MSRLFKIAFALTSIFIFAGANMAQAASETQTGTKAVFLTLDRTAPTDHRLAVACDFRVRSDRSSHRRDCGEELYAQGGAGVDG
jgi:hypothetical protein